MKKKILITIFNFGLITLNCCAQNNIIDSIGILFKAEKSDTIKIDHLNNLCWEYRKIGLYDTAMQLGNKALQLSQQLNFKKGIANSYSNIGVVYWNQSNYPKALDYYFKALKLDEELNNKKGIAKRLGNIGVVYSELADYGKALEYYFKALKLGEELGDKNRIAIQLGNIGNVYIMQVNFPKALEYCFRALKIKEELGDKNGVSGWLSNIANIYFAQKDYTKALDYDTKALKIAEEVGDKNGVVRNRCNIGSLYIKTGKFKEAEQNLKKAITVAQEIGALNELKQAEESLSSLFDTAGQHQLALIHYKKAMALKDTIFSQENKKQLVRKEMNYEFDKKQAASKAEQELKDQKAKNEKEIIYDALVLLVIASIGVVWFFIQRRKLDKIKAIQEKDALEKNKFELELKWFNSELKALRSQMNPHFIFNCMASIQRFMVQNDATSAARFLSKFARLMRAILENSEQSFISLDAELKMLEDYLDLEKLRFGKKFNFFITIEESINPELIEIPSMLIQPFIENSIIHGISPREDENGRIDIVFKVTETILRCEIIDNGVGRKKAGEIKKQTELTHKSMGMSILKERLELINAKENIDVYSRMIDLEDDDHVVIGTKVEINIPFLNRK